MSTLKARPLFSDGSTLRILSFDVRAGGNLIELAINIQKIKEIVETDDFPLQQLTENFRPIVGLLNLRGISVPVLDLEYFLTGSESRQTELRGGQRIIICEFQRLQLGILIEKTHKIKQFENSRVQKVPDALNSLTTNVFNGIIELEGKFIQLLDIEFILTKLNVDVAPDAKNTTEFSLQNKRVLVVEDSKLFQKKLIQLFRAKGADVTIAEDGMEGLEKLEQGLVPDLIFTDIEMPRLNGIGMVRKIKASEEWKGIPVIFNTSISNQGLIEDITSEGLGEYIVKFDEKEIANALRKQKLTSEK